jgi:aryl-alcohol dehydrogenase-like predicted oxidoreductase
LPAAQEITMETAPSSTGLPLREVNAYRQSVLVLGAAQLGGAYGIANTTGAPDQPGANLLLRSAAEWGVTHVDTARAYGDSEHRIGVALSQAGGPALKVITKIAPIDAAVTSPPAVREAVDASMRASRRALASAGPVTVLLHRATDAFTGDAAAWQRLRELREQGGADRIGVSVQSPAELLAVIGLPDLGYVQLPCNVLDRRWLSPAVAAAMTDHPDLVVTVRSVYLQGLLAAGRAVHWPHLPDERRDAVVDALDELAARFGCAGRPGLCVAYILGLPWVTSVVIGAETWTQLRENVRLVAQPPLSAADREEVLERLPVLPDDLFDPSRWGTR